MGCESSKDNSADYILEAFRDHDDAINCIAISEDHSLLATGSEDTTIRMWSTKTETTECLGILKGHTSYITCVTICDAYLISGSADNTIRKWDMTTCECIVKYVGHKSRISRVICTGRVIFSTCYDKTSKVWDFIPDPDDEYCEAGCIRTFEGHTKGVYPMIFIPATDLEPGEDEPVRFNMADIFITGSADNTARTWCPETGTPLKVLKGHRGPLTCMVTDPQGVILYTGSADKSIKSWDIKAGTCLKDMDLHDGPVICLLVVNRLMYSGSQDGHARCWVREFGDCTRVYKGHKHSIVALKFNEGILYTGSGDTCIRAFDAKTGVLKRLFLGHDAAVTCLAIVGDKLYSGSFDGSLRVWSIKNINDVTNEDEAEEMEDHFQRKQDKSLADLDTRLNGYIKNDVDMSSTPDNRCT